MSAASSVLKRLPSASRNRVPAGTAVPSAPVTASVPAAAAGALPAHMKYTATVPRTAARGGVESGLAPHRNAHAAVTNVPAARVQRT